MRAKPWHRAALFGPGPRRPLSRDERARFRYLLSTHRRARRLTPCGELVGQALLKRLGEDGRCDPAHATLAADAGVCDRTVRRVMARLRTLGLVSWQMRLIRAGWRAEQTSNAYELTPAGVPACGGQTGRATMSLCTKELTSDALEARAALAEVRKKRELVLAAALSSGMEPWRHISLTSRRSP